MIWLSPLQDNGLDVGRMLSNKRPLENGQHREAGVARVRGTSSASKAGRSRQKMYRADCQ